MKTKGRAWKLKNKGFTLIEMIVTVAIIAIFSGVVLTFISTGSGVYRNTFSNSKVQMETQETFDKIEDLIIDANRSLYYANGSGSNIGTEIQNDIKEKDGTNSAGSKTFISCNEYDNNDGTSQYIYDVLDWQASDGKIYYSRREYTAQSSNDNSENEDQNDADIQALSDESEENAISDGSDIPVKAKNAKTLVERSVLASGILDFRADVSKVKSDKIVRFQLSTKNGNKQIQTLHSVSLRNNVDLKKPADAFNNAEATDVGIKIINAPESMDPGESIMLAYGLTGNGTIDPTTVTWTIVESSDNGSFPSYDHTNGRLTISDNGSGSIKVQVSAVSTAGQLVKSQIVMIKINAKETPSPTPTPTPAPRQLILKPQCALLGAGQSYQLSQVVQAEMVYDDNSVKTDGYTLTWTSTPGLIIVDGETLTVDSNAGKDTASGKVTLIATDTVTGLNASIEITIARIDIEKPFGEYKVGQNKEWECIYKEGGMKTETTRTINVTTKPTKAANYFIQGEQVQGTFAKSDVGSWEITAVVNLTIRNGIGQVQDVTSFSVDESEGGGEIHTPQSSGGDLAYVVAPGLKYQCGVDEYQDFQFKIEGVGFYKSYETIEWGIKGDDSIKLEPMNNSSAGALSMKYTFTVGENSEGFVIWAKYTKHTTWDHASPIELEAYAEKTVSVITGISISTIPPTLKVGERYIPAINVNIKSPQKNSNGTYTSRAEVIPNIMNGDKNTWIHWKGILESHSNYFEKETYDQWLTAFTLKSLLPDNDNLKIVAELAQMPFLVKMLNPNYVTSMEVSSEN